jgi:hypothetical protein
MTTPSGQESSYTSSVEDCDVKDRAKLVAYRAKRAEWLRGYELRRDEPNSIQQQLFSMLFVDLAYRTLAEPRRSTDQNVQIAARSGLLSHLLDQCYVANQILAIRRLLDKVRTSFPYAACSMTSLLRKYLQAV